MMRGLVLLLVCFVCAENSLISTLCAQSVAIPQQSAVDAPVGNASPALSLARTQMRSFFPIRIGTRWSYTYRGSMTKGSYPHSTIITVQGQFSETVVHVDYAFGPSIGLVGMKVVGDSRDSFDCPTRGRGPSAVSQRWYVIGRFRVFVECSRGEAIELAWRLKKSPSDGVRETPEYVLPFAKGNLWGMEPDTAKRDDDYYQWSIEDGEMDVTVPAGRFSGCYAMLFQTLPDHEVRWLCPGVGLVANEYEHHGTIDQYRTELQTYTRGSGRRRKPHA